MRHKQLLLMSAAGLGTLLAVGTVSAQTMQDNGFKSFPQDSCDPLLVGVLTSNGYENSDLERLYAVAYGASVEQACGFAKGGFEIVDPVAPAPPPGDDLVNNVPDLPPLNPIDLPEPTDFDEDVAVAGTSGFYLAAKGAYLFPQDSAVTHTDTSATNPESFTLEAGTAYGGSGAIGYRFGLGEGLLKAVRGEVQGSYYQLDLDDLTLPATFTQILEDPANGTNNYDTISEGEETVIAGFANLYLDIGLFDLPIRPYVGGGVGYGQRKTSFQVSYSDQASAPRDPESFTQELSTSGIMYQGMIGVGYDLNERIGLEVGYKYLRLPEHDSTAQAAGSNLDTFSMDGRDIHMVEGGITFSF